MPLNSSHTASLSAAIAAYRFPATYFDFALGVQIFPPNMLACEGALRGQLVSAIPQVVKDGLANVLYWGNAAAGYRDHRVSEFRNSVSASQLSDFQAIVARGAVPSLRQVKELRMRGYSGISFVSKVLMFLDPTRFCVLDLQLTQLRTPGGAGAINALTFGTQIPITRNNSAAYDGWRNECARISRIYFGGAFRAVDIERGFFHLIQSGRAVLAAQIYEAA